VRRATTSILVFYGVLLVGSLSGLSFSSRAMSILRPFSPSPDQAPGDSSAFLHPRDALSRPNRTDRSLASHPWISSRGWSAFGWIGGFAPPSAHVALEAPLLADGQFVWGPNVGDFDVRAFLIERDSPLAAYSDSVISWAGYTSVNPKLLLVVLEMRRGLVSDLPADADRGLIDEWVEEASMDLTSAFYEFLYTWGSRRPPDEPVHPRLPSIAFEDGSSVEISAQTNAGTYAVATTLARASDGATWSAQTAPEGAGSFAEVFDSLFPGTDRLDDSNPIDPAAPPPGDMFQLPFPLGATWSFNGPHNWNGGSYPPPFSSMDFSSNWPHDPPFPYHSAVAAAGGSGTILSPNPSFSDQPCWVRIDHGGGWMSSYYHLRNLGPPGNLGAVMPNSALGTIGEEICNGGFASGAHVHFSLLFNGSYVDLEGVELSGWTVHVGTTPYTTGSLQRDGLTLLPYDVVLNDYHTYYGSGDHALRFHGNGASTDRVRVQIDRPENDFAGPAADVGWQDFTIEWWLKALSGENPAGAIACGANEDWKLGNVILDVSRSNVNRSYGASLAGGNLAFGVRSGSVSLTLCGTSTLTDGDWHHIAMMRNRWDGVYPDGYLWLYVDGELEAQGPGPGGDISYPDGAVPLSGDDPYLVMGGAKSQAGVAFSGWLDEIRISNSLRYSGPSYVVPSAPFPVDGNTIALLRLDEGVGEAINDVAGYTPPSADYPGGPSNGLRVYGGSPAGPAWVPSDLFLPYRLLFPSIAK